MNRFVAVFLEEAELVAPWLERALGPDAEIVLADQVSAARVLQLLDAGAADVLFVSFDPEDPASSARLVQEILARRPQLLVIALGTSTEKEILLSAMRAGARDFVAPNSDPMALRRTVEEMLSRTPGADRSAGGEQVAVLCPRPEAAASTLATHLALALTEADPEGEVVLVDLGNPQADSLVFLDLKASYTVADAVRSVRRFDETLVRTAFARFSDRLAVLPRPRNPEAMADIQHAEAIALLGVLRSFFRAVVVNLAGVSSVDFLDSTVADSSRVLLVADQCVTTCSAAKDLVDALAARRPAETMNLVVDRYTPKLRPDAERISDVLGVPLLCTLPAHGLLQVEAMNSGRTIFDVAPHSAYAEAVRDLAHLILHRTTRPSPMRAWLRRLGGGR